VLTSSEMSVREGLEEELETREGESEEAQKWTFCKR
jgi:hypothetical protein